MTELPRGELPEFREWLRWQPCEVTGFLATERGQVHPAHVRSWGSSGMDAENIIPLRWDLHAEQHNLGLKSFERKYRINCRRAARRKWREWIAETQ